VSLSSPIADNVFYVVANVGRESTRKMELSRLGRFPFLVPEGGKAVGARGAEGGKAISAGGAEGLQATLINTLHLRTQNSGLITLITLIALETQFFAPVSFC
jgi:hypothetical protein